MKKRIALLVLTMVVVATLSLQLTITIHRPNPPMWNQAIEIHWWNGNGLILWFANFGTALYATYASPQCVWTSEGYFNNPNLPPLLGNIDKIEVKVYGKTYQAHLIKKWEWPSDVMADFIDDFGQQWVGCGYGGMSYGVNIKLKN